MIKFFRKIRQQLLSDLSSEASAKGGNKFSKYLLYAIGEIILVVIGILIALQINNWNENSQLKKKEKILLEEMVRNLNSDADDLSFNIRENLGRIQSNQIILDVLESKSTLHDSLSFHFGNLLGNFQLTENTAAWENLKSVGFDLISNDVLRNKIANLYSTKYKYLENLEQRVDDNYQWDHMYPQILKNINIKKVWASGSPNDYEALQNDREFKEVLKMNLSIRNFIQIQYKAANKDVKILIMQIEKHLETIYK